MIIKIQIREVSESAKQPWLCLSQRNLVWMSDGRRQSRRVLISRSQKIATVRILVMDGGALSRCSEEGEREREQTNLRIKETRTVDWLNSRVV